MAKNKPEKPVYESVDELAAELGISRQSAYSALRTGLIPSLRLGRRFIIPRAAVADWLASARRVPPARPDTFNGN